MLADICEALSPDAYNRDTILNSVSLGVLATEEVVPNVDVTEGLDASVAGADCDKAEEGVGAATLEPPAFEQQPSLRIEVWISRTLGL